MWPSFVSRVRISQRRRAGGLSVMDLDTDTLMHILELVDSPVDLASVGAVSRLWRQLVIEGSFWKLMCLKRFPELRMFKEAVQPPCSSLRKQDWEHSFYCRLYSRLTKGPRRRSCISATLGASSTDNLPQEDMIRTLYPEPRTLSGSPSYWSSKGQSKVEVPETLTYKLLTPLCVVQQIRICPFKAYFQYGQPIYSSDSVRFKLGRLVDGDYLWSYVSPAYTMEQEDKLQTFCLPRPVVCIGGVLQVELLGRVQTQRTDGLYYICISYVDVRGTPIYGVDYGVRDNGKHLVLKDLVLADKEEDEHDVSPRRTPELDAGYSDPYDEDPYDDDDDDDGIVDFIGLM